MTGNKIDINKLTNIAIYLEGFKQGQGGNIYPLGNDDLEELWDAIFYIKNEKHGKERKDSKD